jgi:hypothetical protein
MPKPDSRQMQMEMQWPRGMHPREGYINRETERTEACMPEYASGEKDVREQSMQGRDSSWKHACLGLHPEVCMPRDASGGKDVPDGRLGVCIPEYASGGKGAVMGGMGGMHTGVRIRRSAWM